MSFTCKYLFVIYFVILVLTLTIAVSASSCSNKACCFTMKNSSVINLSEIGRKDNIPRFYYVPHMIIQPNNLSVLEALYSYNPCYSFSQVDPGTVQPEFEKKCENAAACKLINGKADGSPPELYAIGSQEHASFHEDKEDEYSISYLVSGSPKLSSNLTIHLVCEYDTEHKLEVTGAGKGNHTMTLTTKCACPDMCKSDDPPSDDKHGLSTGSALLITFFVIVIVYFGLGATYNFCNGAHGSELLPHSTFWTDFPQLVMDGFLFTCSCFTKKSQSNYSDM